MEINLIAVLAATAVMFGIGAIWYTLFFGKMWAKIHGFDKLTKEEQAEMSKAMTPWYGLQALVTFISAYVLALLIHFMPDQSPYYIAFLVWLGFALPTEVSAQVFGGSPKGYVWHKIAIASAELLVRLIVAALVISLF